MLHGDPGARDGIVVNIGHGTANAPDANSPANQRAAHLFQVQQNAWTLDPLLKRDYPDLPPIYITENGMANADEVVNGKIVDEQRIRYIGGHLCAIDQAMRGGVDVRGYFA